MSVHEEGYSRNVHNEGYSRNVPDEGYSRNVPDKGYSRNVPDEGYSRNVPDKGYSRNVRDEGYSRNVPDKGYSRNVPDKGYSRNVPDEGYYRNALNLISTFILHIYMIAQFPGLETSISIKCGRVKLILLVQTTSIVILDSCIHNYYIKTYSSFLDTLATPFPSISSEQSVNGNGNVFLKDSFISNGVPTLTVVGACKDNIYNIKKSLKIPKG